MSVGPEDLGFVQGRRIRFWDGVFSRSGGIDRALVGRCLLGVSWRLDRGDEVYYIPTLQSQLDHGLFGLEALSPEDEPLIVH